MIKAEWTNADALDLQPTCNKLATDCISRHAVSAWLDNIGHPEFADVVMDENRFPSAQPERPKGHWIHVGDGYTDYFRCSECGNLSDYEENFCCECGSDNRGEQDAEIR